MADDKTSGYEPETMAILAGRDEGETSLAPVLFPTSVFEFSSIA